MHAATSLLVGYNQTPEALAAFRWALEAARVRHLPIHVVQAGRVTPHHAHHPDAPALTELAAPSEDWGVTITTEQVPSASVADLARVAGADAIVVIGARHANSGLHALLGGSTSATIRESTCPLVVARPAAHPNGPVVVGLSDHPESLKTLAWAFDHASRHHLPVHAVHAYHQPVYSPDGAQESHAQLADRTTQSEDLLLHEEVAGFVEQYPDVTLTSQAVHDSAAHALIRASQDASLVVMGTRAHSLILALLVGSPPQVVAPRSACSVAVIPHRGTPHE
jgi:nucleotide-binding universal stress UspA family protein